MKDVNAWHYHRYAEEKKQKKRETFFRNGRPVIVK